ncbi:uncharacterized protein BDR25DRAFT_308200 [Lindgomyces ingoldianus]|uniref:Uncharacterized protein n=1 Tax=Lindgomyces ingoldianus TaxID=673940 RepID=A0ACB6Q734_9PLEO|nr:uncharacterized protein BDR25DRAFT_308200 [Lindgomyces ingoldianus]KAF2462648.1 hypothetical protein BDR25DRAFT_308200 [Lindgomyces ingoldianus]
MLAIRFARDPLLCCPTGHHCYVTSYGTGCCCGPNESCDVDARTCTTISNPKSATSIVTVASISTVTAIAPSTTKSSKRVLQSSLGKNRVLPQSAQGQVQ